MLLYNCSILKCSHNKNGVCLGECEKECTDYPVVEYISTDQLRNANRCSRYSKQKCNGCPDIRYCPNYDIINPLEYENWLVDNYLC